MSATAEQRSRIEVPDFTPVERAIINRLQTGLPLTRTPYKDVAEEIGMTEQDLLDHLKALLANGTLTRFGPMFHAGEMGAA